MNTMAFIGDVHGNSVALKSLIGQLELLELERVVLLGDYVNKGPDSFGVVDFLANYSSSLQLIPLAGNHEVAFLDSLETKDVRPLLRMAGAPTIRSYVGGDVEADVLTHFRRSIPKRHLQFLAMLGSEYEDTGVFATHRPEERAGRFNVSAHIEVGPVPRIDSSAAQIDTGCGSDSGRLTALLWPSLDYLQVDEVGVAV